MQYEIKNRSFGETIQEAFKIYKDNFSPLFLIALIGSIPNVLMPPIDSGDLSQATNPQAILVKIVPLFIIFIFLNIFTTALMIEFISKRYMKQNQSPIYYLQNVLQIIFPILGLSILQILIVIVGFIPIIYPVFYLLFFPVVYFILALSIAPQALIIERKGVIDSIRRSIFLTNGNKLKIFGYMLVYTLFLFAAVVIGRQITLVLERAGATVGIQRLIEHLIQVSMFPVNACLFILVYYNLRIGKEGFKKEEGI